MRGLVPTVVLSDIGRNGQVESAQPFIQRLRALAPAMPILALRPEHVRAGAAGDGFDGVVVRPSSPSADPKRWHLYRTFAERVRDELGPWLRGEHKTSARAMPKWGLRSGRDLRRRVIAQNFPLIPAPLGEIHSAAEVP